VLPRRTARADLGRATRNRRPVTSGAACSRGRKPDSPHRATASEYAGFLSEDRFLTGARPTPILRPSTAVLARDGARRQGNRRTIRGGARRRVPSIPPNCWAHAARLDRAQAGPPNLRFIATTSTCEQSGFGRPAAALEVHESARPSVPRRERPLQREVVTVARGSVARPAASTSQGDTIGWTRRPDAGIAQ
jgi:hypothetical protein